MNTDWFLNLPPALLLVILAGIARIQQRSWFAPGAFFSLVWAFFVLTPLIFAPDFIVKPLTIWGILVCTGSVYLGSIFGMAAGVKRSHIFGLGRIEIKYLPALNQLIILGSLLGIGAVLILLLTTGRSLYTMFSIELLAKTGHELAVARYHEGYTPPLSVRMLMIGTYLAALLSGLLLATKPVGIKRWISYIPLLPALGFASLLTTRSTVLYTLVLWLGAYFATRVVLNNGNDRLFTYSQFMRGGGILLVVLLMFILLQMSRAGFNNLDGMLLLLSRLRIWFFGHLAGFSAWLEQEGLVQDSLSLGEFTFAGIFDILGISNRNSGIFQDFVYISDDYNTNIFTVFRGLIEDYSVVGTLVLLFTLGVLGGLVFQYLRRGELLYLPILSAFYSITLLSHITSLLNYNTLLLAWFLFAVYLLFIRIRPPIVKVGG